MLTPREIADTAVKTLDAKQAKDIKLLHTTDLTVLADYFIICTATSSTHVKTCLLYTSDAAENSRV